MGEIIQSLKEFIWDIIGFMIPGFTLIIAFNFLIDPIIAVKNSFIFDWNEFQPILLIIVSYILGFVIYSLTMFKIKTQDQIIEFLARDSMLLNKLAPIKFFIQKYIVPKHSKNWELKFKESSTVLSAKNFLTKAEYKKVDQMELNEIRNILMSRNPQMDEKVYTFMFRSSVFDHLSTVLLIFSLIFYIQCILILFDINIGILKTETPFKIFYIIAIILIPLLGNCKRLFYSISQRIPFSNLN